MDPDHGILVGDDDDRRSFNDSFSNKARKPNWTNHEIRALLEGYDRNRDLLRSRGVYKASGERAVNNAQRQGIWEEITAAVNKSRPYLAGAGPYNSPHTNCKRTTKEVIKKWVNLVNRMKADVAIRKSNAKYELGAVARAVYTIVSTDEPLTFRGTPLELDNIIVKEEPADYLGTDGTDDDSNFSGEVSQTEPPPPLPHRQYRKSTEELPTHTDAAINKLVKETLDSYVPIKPRPSFQESFLQTNIKEAILKRHQKHNGSSSEDADKDDLVDFTSTPRNAKRRKIAEETARFSSIEETSQMHGQDLDYDMTANDEYITAEENEDNMKETYKLNREIMELQKRKLEVEIERMVVEKEKAEIEKEQMIIEKDMALLRKEKLQMEVDQFRHTIKDRESNDRKGDSDRNSQIS